MKIPTIRPLALALIKNSDGKFLFHEGKDSKKGESFYRPLGGGIDFGETGMQAVVREFEEEIGQSIEVEGLAGVFENIFTYEGKPGHEIVLLYNARFSAAQTKESYEIMESGTKVGTAVWRSVEEIRSARSNIYPVGIERFLE